MTSCTGSVRGGFGGGDLKKVSWVESCRPKKKGDFRSLAKVLCRMRTWFGADGKVRCISLLMSKNLLTQKVIKKFHTWTKKSYVFFVIRDSYVLRIYICYEHSMYISHIHIMGMLQYDVKYWKKKKSCCIRHYYPLWGMFNIFVIY